MKKKIYITGGLGFIGYNCYQFFKKKNFKVKLIDNLSRKTSKINLQKIIKENSDEFEKIDIKVFSKLKKSIQSFSPDYIINCAGQVAVTTSIVNPRADFESNALGTFNILEVLRICNLKTKLIHLSTNKVYGNLEYLKTKQLKEKYIFKNLTKGIDEKINLDFHSPYGCSKGSADQYVIDYRKIYNLNTYVIRQSCIYGPNQYGLEDQGWVSWMTLCSILNKKINIFGDGKQVRDLLYIDDLVDLFYKILINKKKINNNVFNCGGGPSNAISILQLFKILEKINKKKLKRSFKDKRKGDQKIFISNNNRLKKNFGWKPKVDKEKGISLMHTWMHDNLDKLKNCIS